MATTTSSPFGGIQALRSALQELTRETQTAAGAMDSMRQQVEKTHQAVSALDDLYARVSDAQNAWDEELQLQLELVRVGGQSLQELMRLWGDAVVATEDGNKKLRELFQGADLRQYTQQIQELIEGLRKGSATVGDVLEYLKTNAAQLSKALVDTVEAFRRGEVSLERVQAIIAAIKRDYANTDLETLAKALEEALRRGAL